MEIFLGGIFSPCITMVIVFGYSIDLSLCFASKKIVV